jgi:hypothetical protein
MSTWTVVSSGAVVSTFGDVVASEFGVTVVVDGSETVVLGVDVSFESTSEVVSYGTRGRVSPAWSVFIFRPSSVIKAQEESETASAAIQSHARAF